MLKRLILFSILFFCILEYLLLLLVIDKYGDIMWIGKISVYLIIIIILNIILFLRSEVRFKKLLQLMSLLILLIIPISIFIFKPDYTVGEAQSFLEDRKQDSLKYTRIQEYKNEKVYVFYSKRTKQSYFLNPYNGDFGNLKSE